MVQKPLRGFLEASLSCCRDDGSKLEPETHTYIGGGQWNYSFRPGPEEEHQAAPQRASLRDTQYVLGDYVTMYISKDRNRSIAQVGTLTNALLVQYIC